MPLYRIGWIPNRSNSVVFPFALLVAGEERQTVVQPSLAINSSTVIKPVKCRQILVYATLPARFFAANTRKEGNHLSRWYVYSRWIAVGECWCTRRSYSSRLLLVVPPFDPSRAPLTSRLNDSTCFSFSPPSALVVRSSFPRTDNDPLLFIYTAHVSFLLRVYSCTCVYCVYTGHGSPIQGTTRAALVVLLLHSRVAGTRDITIFRARIYRERFSVAAPLPP